MLGPIAVVGAALAVASVDLKGLLGVALGLAGAVAIALILPTLEVAARDEAAPEELDEVAEVFD